MIGLKRAKLKISGLFSLSQRRTKIGLLVSLFLISFLVKPDVEAAAEKSPCVLGMSLEGTIGANSLDYVERALVRTRERNCGAILMRINTPGGNLQTTRMIVERILGSPVPFLCLVSPAGGHAGSAGALILQACHVSGAIETTNIGAATPVSLGPEISKDLRQKIINDTVSWVEGLAKLRGRNLSFAKEIVVEAKSVSADEAKKVGAIDLLSKNEVEFLAATSGRTVKGSSGSTYTVAIGNVKDFAPDFRFKLLEIFADPQIAYLVFMGSLALLYFEFTHTGLIAPGVIGAMGLLTSLISFHKLDVWWGGLALMLLGIIFMIAEIFVPAFGALGIGGVVSFALGGVFLFDQESGYHLPLGTILPTALVAGGFMLFLSYLAFKTLRLKSQTGKEILIGQNALVKKLETSKTGQAFINGELWKFECDEDVKIEESVHISRVKDLKLIVKRIHQ